MSDKSCTTMPLPVKDVRGAAARVLKAQRDRLDKKLRDAVELMNSVHAKDNQGFFHRLFRRPDIPMMEVEPTIEQWKAKGVGSQYHPAYWLLEKRHSRWWLRLEQFVLLPKSDDEVVMSVSIDDLDLIEYNEWKAEA